MTRADYTRTCDGCGSVVTEDWVNGQKCFRCYAPVQTCGYIVGIERFLPYVPAWCPKMGGCLRPPGGDKLNVKNY